VLETDTPANTVEPGEFLFGYTNAYGAVARGPEVDEALDVGDALAPCPLSPGRRDFACDGSFMVWRQLEEHVQEFWRAIHERCRDDAAERRRLAAKLFGRWPSGAPLVLAPEVDDPALEDANDFGYVVDDPHGYHAPLGAHIRRANPRDWNLARDPSRSTGIANAHRIIRRGRPYGPPLVDSMDPEEILRAAPDGAERGVQFVCFMADIERQFELIQGTWLNDEKFAGLYDEGDPVLGAAPERTGLFTVQATPLGRRVGGLSRFVSVRGGAYLFMPGIPALRFLGALQTDPTDPASLEPIDEPT
jgi:Dyp-type peroxidase family